MKDSVDLSTPGEGIHTDCTRMTINRVDELLREIIHQTGDNKQ